MKVSKSDIKYLGLSILTWTFLNLLFNILGLFITKLLNEAQFTLFESVKNEFVMPLVIQSILFSICLISALILMKNKKFVQYIFVVFQFVAFHIIFILNLNIHHGMHFESTFNNIGLKYLSYSGQYLIDILYLYFPINGNFENGMFLPDNVGTFYFHWIFLGIVYYFALTWISIRVVKFFSEKKSKIQPESNHEDLTESQP